MSATVTSANPNWKQIFTDVQKAANIPDISGTEHDVLTVTVRDLYVSLPDAVKQLPETPQEGTTLEIYCDVLSIPADVRLDRWALVIAARRIEVAGSAAITLDFTNSDIPTIAIFAQEIAGNLHVPATGAGQDNDTPIATVTPTGFQISKDGQETLGGIQDPQLGSGSPLELSLVAIFQCATVLAETKPDISKSMLQWVQQCTKDTAMSDLYLQSTSMLTVLDADVTFVPYLSQALYQDEANAFLDAAQAYEQQYQRLTDKNEAIEARIAAARVMAANQTDNTDYIDKLIEQTSSNLESARRTVVAAEAKFHSEQNLAEQAQVAFQSGLDQWKYDQTVSAAFKIIGAVVDFSVCIGGLMMGGAKAPGGGAGPGEDFNKAKEGAATAVKAAESADQLKKAMEAVGKLVEALKKTYEIASQLADTLSISDTTDHDASLGGEDAAGDPVAAWTDFQIHADAALKVAIENKVPSSTEYQVALDTLVVYAQSLTASRVSFIKVSQDLVRLKLQKEMSEKQQARLDGYVKDLATSEKPNTAMMQILFQHYLDMKRWLYVAMQHYGSAYKYWALRESSAHPSITNSVADFKRAMAQVANDYNAALASFDPSPQTAQNLSFEIDDPKVIDLLKQNGTADWIISLDDSAFSGMDRVRLTSVQVWLDGAKSKGSQPHPTVSVQIETTGAYQDRFKGTNYTFTSAPLRRLFQYRLDNNQVVVPGTVAQEEQFAYFQPTPFAGWSIKVDKSQVDLSNLSAIRMEFEASIISNLS
jgi:hypothetical protein